MKRRIPDPTKALPLNTLIIYNNTSKRFTNKGGLFHYGPDKAGLITGIRLSIYDDYEYLVNGNTWVLSFQIYYYFQPRSNSRTAMLGVP
jgi:hypothetical protein